jgi:hypothetical protein
MYINRAACLGLFAVFRPACTRKGKAKMFNDLSNLPEKGQTAVMKQDAQTSAPSLRRARPKLVPMSGCSRAAFARAPSIKVVPSLTRTRANNSLRHAHTAAFAITTRAIWTSRSICMYSGRRTVTNRKIMFQEPGRPNGRPLRNMHDLQHRVFISHHAAQSHISKSLLALVYLPVVSSLRFVRHCLASQSIVLANRDAQLPMR